MTDTLTPAPTADERRTQRILEAALAEFGRRGVSRASMRAIARAAGVAPATLRRRYPSRDELFREVVRTVVLDTVARLEPPVVASGRDGAEARIQAVCDWFWRLVEEPAQAALLRLALGELVHFPELALFHATEIMGRAARRLEHTLAEGVRRGDLRPMDTDAATRIVLAALVMHAHWFAHPGIYGGFTGPDRRRAEARLVGVLAEGLRARHHAHEE